MADDKKKLCFVVGPIGEAKSATRIHADWLLQEIIVPVFDKNFPDFRVVRADRMKTPGMIDSQMINHLLDAELVIADMSLRNVNAFYEMGIRHMAQKPIIHMYLEGTEIPFDVAPHRAIPFSLAHPDDLAAARTELIEVIKEATSPDFKIENPVTRARGIQEVKVQGTPAEKMILDRLEALERRNSPNPLTMPASYKSSRNQPPRPYSIGVTFQEEFTPPSQEKIQAVLKAFVQVLPRPIGVSFTTDIADRLVLYPSEMLSDEEEEEFAVALLDVDGVKAVNAPSITIS